jgi:hypothetical protein
MATIDEALNTALNLLERGAMGETELVATWIVDNLVHVLDEHRAGDVSRCNVAGYDVLRVGDQIAVTTLKAQIMDSQQARMLAAALLRAAEAVDG